LRSTSRLSSAVIPVCRPVNSIFIRPLPRGEAKG
jgi:hypothetical protein